MSLQGPIYNYVIFRPEGGSIDRIYTEHCSVCPQARSQRGDIPVCPPVRSKKNFFIIVHYTIFDVT